MSVIAEYTVSADSFALAATLEQMPEMTIEIERVVAHAEDRVTPYFWVQGDDYAGFERAVKNDPSTRNVTKLDEYDGGTLYRTEWTQNVESIGYAYTEIGATILEATGREDNWQLRMRFDDEHAVADFGNYCRRNDVAFTLNRLYHPSEPMAGGQHGLSPKQREALVLAVERGYFRVPRDVTMTELADQIGITQQSLSKRMRRGHRNLIKSTLTVNHMHDGDTA